MFDNIFVERLWRSVKYEEVYLKDYQTPEEPIMAHYEDYGFQGRLAKPFTAVELSEVLKEVLGEKQGLVNQ
ncbi:unnamed protein product [marine sediment metagenome]|uniref:Uncharacterized protein n=1 Tax=marine sediment metagenome TaxID=412755 RepID=X0YTV2_9ZZZZ